MNKRTWALSVATLSVLLFALTACGSEESTAIKSGEPASASLEHLYDDEYLYTVKNNSEEPVSFDFTSSQRFDYAITKDDETVFQFSTVSSYLTVLGSETVESSQPLEYYFSIPTQDLDSGDYELTTWLTPDTGSTLEKTIAFSIE